MVAVADEVVGRLPLVDDNFLGLPDEVVKDAMCVVGEDVGVDVDVVHGQEAPVFAAW